MGTLVFQATLGGAVNIIGPNIANTINFTLPSADGTSGQTWTTNGSGVLAFGTLGIAGGGTGQITATAAFNALAPSQSGQSGKYLTTDGTNTSWGTNPLGTVTSVAATVPSFLSIAGSPITTSGTLAFTLSGTALPTTSGGTGLTSFTSGGVVYASSSSALATGSALTFDGTTATTPRLALGGTTFPAAGTATLFSRSSDNNTYLQTGSGNNVLLLDSSQNTMYNVSPTFHDFLISNSGAMRLTSTGLGIGTTSPAYKLDVAGQFARIGQSGGAGAGLILAGASATKNWVIANQYNVSGALEFTQTTATGGSTIGSTPSMVLSASENLGLGVTPSAWGNGLKAIQVGSLSGISMMGYSSAAEFGNNFYYDTDYRYGANASASLYVMNAGKHTWSVAGSGTAGNAISFTQAMTLTAAGQLLVGSTSAIGSPYIQTRTTNSTTVSGTYAWNSTDQGISLVNESNTTGTGIGITMLGGSSRNSIGAIYMVQETGNSLGALAFYTGGAGLSSPYAYERARIDSSGNLSLGTTSASGGRLTVKTVGSSGANAMQVKDSADTVRMELSDNGYIRFPTVYGTYTSAAAANVYMYTDGGLYRSTSSLKYKKNVADSTHGLVDLLKLRSVTYEGKSEMDSGKTFGGFIAEEVHDAGLTEFVQYAEDGSPDALAYGNMVALCVKAIQEQQAIIESLKARLDAANL
jgi:hypothetical protein